MLFEQGLEFEWHTRTSDSGGHANRSVPFCLRNRGHGGSRKAFILRAAQTQARKTHPKNFAVLNGAGSRKPARGLELADEGGFGVISLTSVTILKRRTKIS